MPEISDKNKPSIRQIILLIYISIGKALKMVL